MKLKQGNPISRRLAGLLLALGILFPLPGWPQAVPSTEQQFKAAFMLNFAKYTTWPKEALSDTNTALTLGVVGNDLPEDALKFIKGKPIKDRQMAVIKFNDVADAVARQKEVAGCHILFVGASEKGNLAELFKLLDKTNVLTIGEVDGFLEHGGVINFVVENKKLRFEIKQGAAQRANLKLDPQLMKLAKAVKD